jgi:FMN phosphatase YigB (HAD superfamily)
MTGEATGEMVGGVTGGVTGGVGRVERRGAAGTAAPGRPEVATFDVFETVLVRAVSPPQAVFDLAGRRAVEEGLLACSPQAFGRARAWAESRALHWHRAETTLERIYAELTAALGLPAEAGGRLGEIEMEVEAELLQPVPAGARLVQEHRARAGSVVYVSDMYLPAEFIQAQLERHGLFVPGDVLYVSHAHGSTKRGGALYDVVAEAEGVPTSALLHHGNDRRSDVEGAATAGARSVLLPAANPNRYEKALQEHRTSTDGLTATMAGASRLARLHVEPNGAREEALVDVAAGVMAPVLVAYVTWVLRRSEALGLRRVYFVARDGQVLLRVAEHLAPRLGIDLELRYLYGSRLVWNRVVASPTTNPQVWHSLIGLSSDGVANRDILERTGLDPATVERVIAGSGAGPDVWASTTDRAPLFETLDRIEADGTLGRPGSATRRSCCATCASRGCSTARRTPSSTSGGAARSTTCC